MSLAGDIVRAIADSWLGDPAEPYLRELGQALDSDRQAARRTQRAISAALEGTAAGVGAPRVPITDSEIERAGGVVVPPGYGRRRRRRRAPCRSEAQEIEDVYEILGVR